MKLDSRGQALLEFAISFPLLVIAATGSVLLFRTEWNRTLCAHKAFWAAHRQLRMENEDATIHMRCGEAIEIVELPKLENAKW